MIPAPVKKVNVVLIGETGSGKSTVINYITNYFRHGTLDHMKIAIPTEFYPSTEIEFKSNEANISDKTQSKTIRCNEYVYADRENRDNCVTQFCFIDTPGLGDTRGIQFDKTNIKQIFDLVQQMESLGAILLIINGTQPRLTFNIEYDLQQFRHWLPNAVLENVVVILTNCNRHTVNFEPETIGLPSTVKIFYMQNSAFSNNRKKLNPQFKQRLEDDWNQSMDTLNKIIDLLKTLPPLSTQTFIDMDSDKNDLRSLLHESRLIIKELQTLADALKKKTRLNQMGKVYTMIPVNYHNTLCSNCHYVCDERCTLNKIPNQGDDILSACTVFTEGGQCKKCPEKCTVKYHYHAKRLIKPIERSLSERLKAIEDEQGLKSKAAIEKKLQNQLAEIERCDEHLVKTCAEFNIAAEFHLFINYLHSDIKQLKSSGTKRQANKFLNKVSSICNMLANHSLRRSNVQVKKEVEDRPATSASCHHMPSTTNVTAVVTGSHQKETTGETFDPPLQKAERQTSTDLKNRRIENVTTDNENEVDIDENYHDSKDSDNDDDDDAPNLGVKQFEGNIDHHICIVQDQEEDHLLKLYRLMKRKERNALLCDAEKLAGIHKTDPI